MAQTEHWRKLRIRRFQMIAHRGGGGQAGAVVMTLQRLEPYNGTQFFLVDLEMGEMFAYI